MAENNQRRSNDERGGFQRRQWRDQGDRSWRGEDRGDHRSFNRDDRGERRSFNRDDRGERRTFQRDDRGERRFNRDDRGGRRFERDDRRDDRSQRRFDRDDRGERGSFQRDDRDQRRFDRDDRGGERRSFNRDDRGPRRFDRDDRGDRRSLQRDDRGPRRFDREDRSGERRSINRDERGPRRFDRDDRGGERRSFQRDDRGERRTFQREDRAPRRFDRDGGSPRRFERDERGGRGGRKGPQAQGDKPWSSTDRYDSPNPDEPIIPAGVSAEELDHEALRALDTLSGPNKDIVARHLVMAGQLIDIEPETAHKHAMAAAARAGRVDVVREAAALTAYASGRYDEALREVRAVRRMRGDDSLRAVEADIERALGRPEKAVEIIDATETKGMELAEQVELVLVSSGARADLGQFEVGLVLVDDALAALPEDVDPMLVSRLMSVKVDRLRELGRDAEADEVEASMPEIVEDPAIIDISMIADADVDGKRTPLRGSDQPLSALYDCALIDLDGTAYNGSAPIEHAAEGVLAAREAGMKTAFVTNNASRTAADIAAHLTELGHEATADMVMTSSMDVVALLKEHLEDGAKILVIGTEGLRQPVAEAGYVVVDSADDAPDAVVQGLDKTLNWERLNEAAFAIERGAAFFATNLDGSLPVERGQALGNGALVRAVRHATGKRPIAGGKPEPGIYQRGAALVGGTKPIAVGDRLETDILGAVNAGIPSLHVLTGVHDARAVVSAPKGQRPSFLGLDMRALNEAHPVAKHHTDGTWTCGFSQAASVDRYGNLLIDGIELDPETAYVLTLDSYRALAAAAWDWASEGRSVRCPKLTVVPNDDPAGIVEAPEPVAEAEAEVEAEAEAETEANDATEDQTVTVEAFLPGEEELAALLGDVDELLGEAEDLLAEIDDEDDR